MTIRHANESDLPALANIHDAAITETDATCYLAPFTPTERQVWWERHRNPLHPLLVAEEERGQVLGYAGLSPWMPGPVYARTVEASVFLAADARGQGLGTLLLQNLLQEAKRLGHHIVIARVWAENAPSLALCQKCGFETVGVQREVGWQHNTWVDCVVLQYFVPKTYESG
jgi:L-amino acid N-acyltransferase YncA